MGLFSSISDLVKFGHEETVGRLLDNWQTNYMDRKVQNRTAALNKELWTYQMNNAYQLTVDDLRKAGLNPLLAVTNGATSAGGHASSASGVQASRKSSWMPSQSLVAAKQLSVLDSQAKRNNAEASLFTANAKSAESQAYINGLIQDAFKDNKNLATWEALKRVLPGNFYTLLASLAGYTLVDKKGSKSPPKPNRAQGSAGKAMDFYNFESSY